ncbi:MAG: M15 family metallopeptidase [Actinomycetota bacterium]|nr:M15 family metallopeptidase [Actinomycetota bacterium]
MAPRFLMGAALVGVLVFSCACSRPESIAVETSRSVERPTTILPASPPTTSPPTTSPPSNPDRPRPTRPDWLGQRPLPTDGAGFGIGGPTPPELVDRRISTVDTLPPPSADEFASSIEVLAGDPLARSTWREGCPVAVADLRYVRVSFRGFDGLAHTGELIVAAAVAEDIVSVFEQLWDAGFPLEEMRIVTMADLDAEPTGDGNNTGSFVCRAVTGGSSFSQHAYGLAIDINSFHNPYVKGSLVLPELAAASVDRSVHRPGMITDGDTVVEAFAAIGWRWGGHWTTLKDWQHFSQNGR